MFGVEADIQGDGIKRKGVDLSGERYNTNLDWFGTVRGRVGYTANYTLIYVTGGFAYGGLRQSGEDNGFAPPVTFKSDGVVTGCVLGGGLEYKFNPSWALKAEYQYLNFGRNDPIFSAAETASADGFHVNDDAYHTVRIGLNYHVGSSYEPMK